jgi:hypothetical protein
VELQAQKAERRDKEVSPLPSRTTVNGPGPCLGMDGREYSLSRALYMQHSEFRADSDQRCVVGLLLSKYPKITDIHEQESHSSE